MSDRITRIARMPFHRMMLLTYGGVSAKLMKDMLDFMPEDAKFCGCGYDHTMCLDYLFFSSSMFKEVKEGGHVPDITPYFLKNPDGTATCTHIIFDQAKDSSIPCPHSWVTQIGFTNSYEYCKLCNEKKT